MAIALTQAKHPSVAGFWTFVREREAIRKRRLAGKKRPWTKDPTLHRYHFCNVRRANDKGTRWYYENVAGAITEDYNLLWLTIVYRMVNSVSWFGDIGGLFSMYEWSNNKRVIKLRIRNARKPYTRAHIILAGKGLRAENFIRAVDWLSKNITRINDEIEHAENFEAVWKILQQVPCVGGFIALQIARDLWLAGFLPERCNEDSFTFLGPGAKRTTLWLMGCEKASQAELLEFTRKLWREQRRYIRLSPKLSLNDVEHCLCEAGKYWKFSRGQGRQRLYGR